MIRRRSATAKVSLLIYLCTAMTGDGAIVLCVGADGHVALEISSVLCCIERPSKPLESSVWLVEDTDGCCTCAMSCGPCTDLPISASFLPANSTSKTAARAKPLLTSKRMLPGAPAIADSDLAQGHYHSPPPLASNPAIRSLHTVVLLI